MTAHKKDAHAHLKKMAKCISICIVLFQTASTECRNFITKEPVGFLSLALVRVEEDPRLPILSEYYRSTEVVEAVYFGASQSNDSAGILGCRLATKYLR